MKFVQMQQASPMFAWSFLAIPLIVLLGLSGCSDTGPASLGPGPDPGPGDEPTLVVTRLVDGSVYAVHNTAPDWVEQDDWIVFTSGPGSIVQKVSTDDRNRVVTVTDPDDDNWFPSGNPLPPESSQVIKKQRDVYPAA